MLLAKRMFLVVIISKDYGMVKILNSGFDVSKYGLAILLKFCCSKKVMQNN